MYKIIVNCKILTNPLMKRLVQSFFLILAFLSQSCSSTEPPNLLPFVPVNIDINLDLPQYQDLLIPGGVVYIQNEGIRGIYIYNLNNTIFKAYDAACPAIDPFPEQACGKMSLEDGISLYCSCDEVYYSLLDGSPQGGDSLYFAKEYQVISSGGNNLKVKNF
jgi:hypothetical protein